MSTLKYYTKEGLNKLKDELIELTTVQRPHISQQIAEARDKGDLSENAEYHAAKEAQSYLELKITKLQDLISNARVADESKMDATKVLLFANVKIKNLSNESIKAYTIVPESESDFKTGKLSVTSPIAKSLLGKSVGDIIETTVPSGTVSFQIIEIYKD
ncbi:MAG: transcription elongation factor GreA [Bacteroidota bacterium]